jgi:hypothetical protein
VNAYEKGCMFDSWSEFFQYDKWMLAFQECGIDVDFYNTRTRSLDEKFPWDFIDIGVTKDFLMKEWQNALDEVVTLNCRERCSGCGATKFGGGVCFEAKN